MHNEKKNVFKQFSTLYLEQTKNPDMICKYMLRLTRKCSRHVDISYVYKYHVSVTSTEMTDKIMI